MPNGLNRSADTAAQGRNRRHIEPGGADRKECREERAFHLNLLNGSEKRPTIRSASYLPCVRSEATLAS